MESDKKLDTMSFHNGYIETTLATADEQTSVEANTSEDPLKLASFLHKDFLQAHIQIANNNFNNSLSCHNDRNSSTCLNISNNIDFENGKILQNLPRYTKKLSHYFSTKYATDQKEAVNMTIAKNNDYMSTISTNIEISDNRSLCFADRSLSYSNETDNFTSIKLNLRGKIAMDCLKTKRNLGFNKAYVITIALKKFENTHCLGLLNLLNAYKTICLFNLIPDLYINFVYFVMPYLIDFNAFSDDQGLYKNQVNEEIEKKPILVRNGYILLPKYEIDAVIGYILCKELNKLRKKEAEERRIKEESEIAIWGNHYKKIKLKQHKHLFNNVQHSLTLNSNDSVNPVLLPIKGKRGRKKKIQVTEDNKYLPNNNIITYAKSSKISMKKLIKKHKLKLELRKLRMDEKSTENLFGSEHSALTSPDFVEASLKGKLGSNEKRITRQAKRVKIGQQELKAILKANKNEDTSAIPNIQEITKTYDLIIENVLKRYCHPIGTVNTPTSNSTINSGNIDKPRRGRPKLLSNQSPLVKKPNVPSTLTSCTISNTIEMTVGGFKNNTYNNNNNNNNNTDSDVNEDTSSSAALPTPTTSTVVMPYRKTAKEEIPHFERIPENIYMYEEDKSLEKSAKKQAKRMICSCSMEDLDLTQPVIRACGSGCLNRVLMIECSSRCPCNEFCSNKQFQKKVYCMIEPFMTYSKGWGLRTLQDIEPGAFVIEYVGEVIDSKEFNKRQKHYHKQERIHYYFMSLKQGQIIDATNKGSYSRFINHSCDPNCETQKWTVNGKLRIGLFAKKRISKYTELTFDYKSQRYGREPQKCFCGSSNCRGYIDKNYLPTATVSPLQSNNNNNTNTYTNGNAVNNTSSNNLGGLSINKRNSLFAEDPYLEEEIMDIYKICNLSEVDDALNQKLVYAEPQKYGLQNSESVIKFCRLMIRTEKPYLKSKLLKILKFTRKEIVGLFVNLQGLNLLWTWMASIPDFNEENFNYLLPGAHIISKDVIGEAEENILLTREIIDIIRNLPANNKDTLEKSKIPRVLERWANMVQSIQKANENLAKICLESHKILDDWRNFKEVFKIPKKRDTPITQNDILPQTLNYANEINNKLGQNDIVACNNLNLLNHNALPSHMFLPQHYPPVNTPPNYPLFNPHLLNLPNHLPYPTINDYHLIRPSDPHTPYDIPGNLPLGLLHPHYNSMAPPALPLNYPEEMDRNSIYKSGSIPSISGVSPSPHALPHHAYGNINIGNQPELLSDINNNGVAVTMPAHMDGSNSNNIPPPNRHNNHPFQSPSGRSWDESIGGAAGANSSSFHDGSTHSHHQVLRHQLATTPGTHRSEEFYHNHPRGDVEPADEMAMRYDDHRATPESRYFEPRSRHQHSRSERRSRSPLQQSIAAIPAREDRYASPAPSSRHRDNYDDRYRGSQHSRFYDERDMREFDSDSRRYDNRDEHYNRYDEAGYDWEHRSRQRSMDRASVNFDSRRQPSGYHDDRSYDMQRNDPMRQPQPNQRPLSPRGSKDRNRRSSRDRRRSNRSNTRRSASTKKSKHHHRRDDDRHKSKSSRRRDSVHRSTSTAKKALDSEQYVRDGQHRVNNKDMSNSSSSKRKVISPNTSNVAANDLNNTTNPPFTPSSSSGNAPKPKRKSRFEPLTSETILAPELVRSAIGAPAITVISVSPLVRLKPIVQQVTTPLAPSTPIGQPINNVLIGDSPLKPQSTQQQHLIVSPTGTICLSNSSTTTISPHPQSLPPYTLVKLTPPPSYQSSPVRPTTLPPPPPGFGLPPPHPHNLFHTGPPPPLRGFPPGFPFPPRAGLSFPHPLPPHLAALPGMSHFPPQHLHPHALLLGGPPPPSHHMLTPDFPSIHHLASFPGAPPPHAIDINPPPPTPLPPEATVIPLPDAPYINDAASNVDNNNAISAVSKNNDMMDKETKIDNVQLPDNWKIAYDATTGKPYYYHKLTKKVQWEPPPPSRDNNLKFNIIDMQPSGSKKSSPDSSTPLSSGINLLNSVDNNGNLNNYTPNTNHAPTGIVEDASQLHARIKEKLRHDLSGFVVQCLTPYMKKTAEVGRITNTEDFKYLARKLTHTILAKEVERHVNDPQNIRFSSKVKTKSEVFIEIYMEKLGPVYVRKPEK